MIRLVIGKRVQHDIGPGPRQFPGDAQSDSRVRSRDDGCLAGQVDGESHGASPCSCCDCIMYCDGGKGKGFARETAKEGRRHAIGQKKRPHEAGVSY